MKLENDKSKFIRIRFSFAFYDTNKLPPSQRLFSLNYFVTATFASDFPREDV